MGAMGPRLRGGDGLLKYQMFGVLAVATAPSHA